MIHNKKAVWPLVMMFGWFIVVILFYCCVCFLFHTCLVGFVVESFAEEQGQHSLFGADHHMIGRKQAVWPLLVMPPCGYHVLLLCVLPC